MGSMLWPGRSQSLYPPNNEANLFCSNSHGGHSSPLQDVENGIVAVIDQIVPLRKCLTLSHTVDLVNTLIDGTNVHKALIQFKKKYSYGKDGTVGIGYWNGLKKDMDMKYAQRNVKNMT